MSNTIIQIKRSQTSVLPSTLNYGELAYSFQSGKIAIGDSSTGVVVIGGNTYTQLLDAATSANTANAIVKRDASGNFSASTIYAELSGNAATATKWFTARDIGVSGDATGVISVDGTANANVPLVLNTVNTNVGTFGGATNIPVFSVNAKGLVTSAANVSVATTLNITGDTGTDGVDLLSETLNFEGGDGVTTTVTDDKVSIAVDNTVIRTSGGQTVGGDLSVSGNLTVSGITTTIDTQSLIVEDSLIKLGMNNTVADALDIGFFGLSNSGSGVRYSGLARTISDSSNFFLFKNVFDDPLGNTIPVSAITLANTATLRANVTGGKIYSLASAIAPADGGTGFDSYTTGDILYASGATTLSKLEDIATGNVLLSGGVGVAPSYGKVGLTTHVSGTLPIANGGTNSTAAPTDGGIAYGDGTAYQFTTAGTAGQALISQATDAPGFGTLDLRGGGLGVTAFNANSVPFYVSGNSLSGASTSTDGHVLQYSSSTGIQFGMLDGGSF